jgi:hypothetical protein
MLVSVLKEVLGAAAEGRHNAARHAAAANAMHAQS